MLMVLVPGVVSLLIAVLLRIRNRVTRGRAADAGTQRVVAGTSVARDAVLAGEDRADRLAIAAALVDLDARGLIAIRAPERGSVPDIEIVDGARFTGLEAEIVSAYIGYRIVAIAGRGAPMTPLGPRRERRRRLTAVVGTIDGDLARMGAARLPARWPSVVIAMLAVIGMLIALLGVLLFHDEPARLGVSGAGFVAALGALIVVPMRVRFPLAASARRRAELATARAVVRGEGATGDSPLAYVTLFGRASVLDRLGGGPDAVSLGDLARAADPGSGRLRLARGSFDLVDSFSMLLP